MKKNEFMRLLHMELETNHVQNIAEILLDYEEHFSHGLAKGKSEEEISRSLGTPSHIAKAHQTERMIRDVKNPDTGFKLGLAFSVIGRLIVIAPFNFIVLFIPGVILFSFLATGWALALAFGSLSVGTLVLIPSIGGLSSTAWTWIAGISTSFGLLGLGALGVMLMFVVSKYILLGLISYLQWNARFVLNNGERR